MKSFHTFNTDIRPISFDYITPKMNLQEDLNTFQLMVMKIWDTLWETIETFGGRCRLRFLQIFNNFQCVVSKNAKVFDSYIEVPEFN